MTDLPERLEALAESLTGDDWDHPVTSRGDCIAAAELRRLTAIAELLPIANEQLAAMVRDAEVILSAQATTDVPLISAGIARHVLSLADEVRRLSAIVQRINPECDGNAIDARDAAWYLFRVVRDEGLEVQTARNTWPWLSEYEASEKARGT